MNPSSSKNNLNNLNNINNPNNLNNINNINNFRFSTDNYKTTSKAKTSSATIADITNLDNELRYFTKLDKTTKEIYDLCGSKHNRLLENIKRDEDILLNQKNFLSSKENESLQLGKQIQEIDERLSELEIELKKGKSEKNRIIEEINEIRRKNSKIFDKRLQELGKLEPKVDRMAKEFGLMINLTKCRILNIEDICSGNTKIVQSYFINPSTNELKYVEFDLKEDAEVRVQKYWSLMKEFFIPDSISSGMNSNPDDNKENSNKFNNL